MWNRRKEDEFVPKSVSLPPTSSELAKEGIPMSTLPGRFNELSHETKSGASAVLGKSVIVKGQIYSREDLTIDGEVEGTVECQEHRLTVGPNGRVRAAVKAREVVVLGTIHGDVETSDKIDIRKDAKLVGDIKTARIGIEDGAYFKGNIDIVRPEPKAAAVKAAAVPPPAPAPAIAAGAAGAGNGPGEVKR
jgi:cytoskeletal protein CcmA (bactofilin family)